MLILISCKKDIVGYNKPIYLIDETGPYTSEFWNLEKTQYWYFDKYEQKNNGLFQTIGEYWLFPKYLKQKNKLEYYSLWVGADSNALQIFFYPVSTNFEFSYILLGNSYLEIMNTKNIDINSVNNLTTKTHSLNDIKYPFSSNFYTKPLQLASPWGKGNALRISIDSTEPYGTNAKFSKSRWEIYLEGNVGPVKIIHERINKHFLVNKIDTNRYIYLLKRFKTR